MNGQAWSIQFEPAAMSSLPENKAGEFVTYKAGERHTPTVQDQASFRYLF